MDSRNLLKSNRHEQDRKSNRSIMWGIHLHCPLTSVSIHNKLPGQQASWYHLYRTGNAWDNLVTFNFSYSLIFAKLQSKFNNMNRRDFLDTLVILSGMALFILLILSVADIDYLGWAIVDLLFFFVMAKVATNAHQRFHKDRYRRMVRERNSKLIL
jgi:hypothetical protein